MGSLDSVRNLARMYRRLPFRVKHPIAQAIKALQLHLSHAYWIKHCERRAYNRAPIGEAIAARRQIPGEIVHGKWRWLYRVRFRLDGTDEVSIVIPVRSDDCSTDNSRSTPSG